MFPKPHGRGVPAGAGSPGGYVGGGGAVGGAGGFGYAGGGGGGVGGFGYAGGGGGASGGGRGPMMAAVGGGKGGECGGCWSDRQVVSTMSGNVVALPAGSVVAGGRVGAAAAGAGSCGGAINCLAGEDCGGQGIMAFVGRGGGDYVTEMTYRYVGEGQGDVRFVMQRNKTYCGIALCVLLVVALVILLMTQLKVTTTTRPLPVDLTTPMPACNPMQFCADGLSWGPEFDRCQAQGKVACCQHDTCQNCNPYNGECETCKTNARTQCCNTPGNSAAPQCVVPCTPPRDCKGFTGFGLTICQATNDVHCCQHDSCQRCQGEAECARCKQSARGNCCAGNVAADQCYSCKDLQSCTVLGLQATMGCKQTNQVNCCISDKCRGCRNTDECGKCQQQQRNSCCNSGTQYAQQCPRPITTPAPTTLAPILPKRCIFWGDPHIVTFDGARPSFYGDGDFWIVKNKEVYIQGRYMGTQYTYGLAATNRVVIGGPFLGGHIIEVQPMDNGGKITVDGREICPKLGCSYNLETLAVITHDDKGKLVDEAASQFARHMVHISLPKGIQLTVFRWTNYLDLDLNMLPLEGGVDGSCGNYNGNPSDDTTQAIFSRVGARVADHQLLFRDRAVPDWTGAEIGMLKTCPDATRRAAEAKCREQLYNPNPSQNLINNCVFDQCFGMNEHALRTARTFATADERARAGEMSSTA